MAVNLKLPRPHDNGFDVGDNALVRLSVDEVRDPTNPQIILQAHIPSGVQALCNALRDAFGQSDQDMVSRSLESFFEFKRGKLTLQEYSVEWDLRYDEAETRSNLHLNEVAKFYLFFKQSGLPNKFIEDVKLQIQGDLSRFADARALALRLSQRGDYHTESDILYGEDTQEPNQDWFDGYDDWNYEGSYDAFYGDGDYDDWNGYDEEEWWYGFEEEEPPWQDVEDWEPAAEDASSSHGPASTPPDDQNKDHHDDYYKGGKGKGSLGLGCQTCGSKWHSTGSCPVNSGSGKGASNHYGKSRGKGYGKFRFPGKGKNYDKGYGMVSLHGFLEDHMAKDIQKDMAR